MAPNTPTPVAGQAEGLTLDAEAPAAALKPPKPELGAPEEKSDSAPVGGCAAAAGLVLEFGLLPKRLPAPVLGAKLAGLEILNKPVPAPEASTVGLLLKIFPALLLVGVEPGVDVGTLVPNEKAEGALVEAVEAVGPDAMFPSEKALELAAGAPNALGVLLDEVLPNNDDFFSSLGFVGLRLKSPPPKTKTKRYFSKAVMLHHWHCR